MDKEKLIDELVRDEALRLKPYRDSKNLLTIGIGRNLDGKGISKAEAYVLCHNDIEEVEVGLDEKLPWWRSLDEVRQRVLVNMCFNMGLEKLLTFKNTLAAIQHGWYADAAREMRASLWFNQVGARAKRLCDAMETGLMP